MTARSGRDSRGETSGAAVADNVRENPLTNPSLSVDVCKAFAPLRACHDFWWLTLGHLHCALDCTRGMQGLVATLVMCSQQRNTILAVCPGQ